ncbi:hypothetical protein [Sutcliffiella rhizosphaerae]|uniref:Head decoration protein n=1 Tax=Sutcliffiella rhizosphaerae TaxID=2880967 RepID=A0ABN8A915_9BACI|nr:hypothetical protein [Sutcliffiella rhizosphaerae]CAG9620876.1 hypothetical protein BACCIP111883_01647 [Sutcliffiella rhizosphaerae]
MPYVKDYGKGERINFLASAKFISFTEQISDAGVTADANGRKIVKAGTIWPTNDENAKGLLFADIDVTEGPQPGSIIREAWVLESRLPVAPSVEAKSAMTGIKYR